MRARVILRVFVTLAALVVAWLVAGPARAAVQAPQCDPRGAITFAPPPQLQPADQSLDIVASDDDCTKGALEARTVVPERVPSPPASAGPAHDAALAPARVPVAHALGERLPVPVASEPRSRPGFRTSVDRPPRA